MRSLNLLSRSLISLLSLSLALALGTSSAYALIGKPDPGHGAFVAVQVAATTADKDKLIESTNPAFKILFGPNITENLSLEFGLMDMGEVSLFKPTIEFSEDDPNDAPSFINAQNGEVEINRAVNNEQASAVYTGSVSYQPRGALVGFRYRFPMREKWDFFLKGGVNIWQAEVERVEITANSDQSILERSLDSRKRAAVSAISGAGVIWQPLNKVYVRAEFDYTTLHDETFIERTTFINYGLGLQYEF